MRASACRVCSLTHRLLDGEQIEHAVFVFTKASVGDTFLFAIHCDATSSTPVDLPKKNTRRSSLRVQSASTVGRSPELASRLTKKTPDFRQEVLGDESHVSRDAAHRGTRVQAQESGPEKGRSCSDAPDTYMMRPSSLSKRSCGPCSRPQSPLVHFTNHCARLWGIPRGLVRCRSSEPTHTTWSLPEVFDNDTGCHTTRNAQRKLLLLHDTSVLQLR